MRNITGRAWENGLSNLDELMSWMYDKEIMNKGERERKDSIFRQYKRYYNDGDAPRGVLRKYGITKYNTVMVELKLEHYLNDFIVEILEKYQGKYSRQDFYLDRNIGRLKDLLSNVERLDAYSTPYWAYRTSANIGNEGIVEYGKQIELLYKSAREEFDQSNKGLGLENNTLEYASQRDDVTLTENFKLSYKSLLIEMVDFAVLIKNSIAILEATKIKIKL